MTYEVVFWDMGGVLVDVEFSVPAARWTARYGTPWEAFESAFFGTGLKEDFDRGQYDAEQVCHRLSSSLNHQITPEDFTQIWRSVVEVREEMLGTFLAVTGSRRRAVLSNTDPIHTESMRRQFAELEGFSFDEWVVSWDKQSSKPDTGIYQAALLWADVPPDRVLFIDDRAENVAAAESLGINAIRFEDSNQLLTALRLALPGE